MGERLADPVPPPVSGTELGGPAGRPATPDLARGPEVPAATPAEPTDPLDAAVARLDDLHRRPPSEQVEVYEDVYATLQHELGHPGRTGDP